MKKCPFCAEEIQDAAIKCRYCGSDLSENTPKPVMNISNTQQAPVELESEKTYYSDSNITVTSTRAVFPGKTYAMANITSVALGEITTSSAGCGCFALFMGLFMCMFLFSSTTIVFGLLGLVVVGIGVMLMNQKTVTYSVKIGSASGEANAIVSPDRSYIQKIVTSVESAIVDRK